MPSRRLRTGELASALPPGGLTLVSSCSAESELVDAEVAEAGDRLGPMTFSGIFVPGLNRKVWRAGGASRGESYFLTPESLVTINSAIEVDLFGQAYAEASPRGFLSGPGGASDYVRGARAARCGLRIVALPASAGAVSRIVAPGRGAGPVSLSRFDIDLVITEHGAADLRAKDYPERAAALIAIAAPEHRDDLAREWNEIAKQI